MRTFLRIIFGILLAFLLGAMSYGGVLSYRLVQSGRQSIKDITYHRSDVLQQLFSYGFVQSTDASTGAVSFVTRTSAGERTLTVFVTDRTATNRQMLLRNTDGVITGISELAPGSITDLAIGTRIAVSFKRNGDILEAIDILFGDPL